MGSYEDEDEDETATNDKDDGDGDDQHKGATMVLRMLPVVMMLV